jgi:hypothetical protein
MHRRVALPLMIAFSTFLIPTYAIQRFTLAFEADQKFVAGVMTREFRVQQKLGSRVALEWLTIIRLSITIVLL